MREPEAIESKWTARPWAARLVRVFVYVFPLVVSIAVAWVLSGIVPRSSSFALSIARWLGIALVSTVVLVAVDRLARLLLPLATLFGLTLAFPDQAPSRFRMALRNGTTGQLRVRIVEARQGRLGDTPAEAAETVLELVMALNLHDRLTRGHSERVRAYTQMIGEEMGLTETELDRLRWSGLLHDIGKLKISGAILNKPGKLTDDEFTTIKLHPEFGRELVAPLVDWLGDSARAVWEHHERWDGTGYPHGLAGTDISLAGRIVAVADTYDVITSVRSYKQAIPASDARAELLRCSGSQFDPLVVRAFMNLSLGRLRLAMGPFSWLAQLPLFPQAVTTGATIGGANAATALVGAAATSLGLGLAADPIVLPDRPAFEVAADAEGDAGAVVDSRRSELHEAIGDIAGITGPPKVADEAGPALGGPAGDEPDPADAVGTDGTIELPDSATTTSLAPGVTTTTLPGRATTTTTFPTVSDGDSRVTTTTAAGGGVTDSDTATTTTRAPSPTTVKPSTPTSSVKPPTQTTTTTTKPPTTTTTTEPTTTTTTVPARPAWLPPANVNTALYFDVPAEVVLANRPLLPLVRSAPTALTVADADHDGRAGITISRTPEGQPVPAAGEISFGLAAPTEARVQGPASGVIYVSTGGLLASIVTVRARLLTCDAGGACSVLSERTGSALATVLALPITFDFGSIDTVIPAGGSLRIALDVPASSSSDVLLSSDAALNPSAITVVFR